VTIQPHRFFRRDGADIQCRVPIPMTTAALGGSIEVPTIDGARARVNIPAGTQTGQQFRLRAKGMSVLRSNARGDMYVQAQIEAPVNLTKDQRELLKTLEESGIRRLLHQSEGILGRPEGLAERALGSRVQRDIGVCHAEHAVFRCDLSAPGMAVCRTFPGR
jgi:molecular chaperone DnaJ